MEKLVDDAGPLFNRKNKFKYGNQQFFEIKKSSLRENFQAQGKLDTTPVHIYD